MVEVLCVPSSSSARANGVNFDYVIVMVSNPICMFPWTVKHAWPSYQLQVLMLTEKHVFVISKLSIGDEASFIEMCIPPPPQFI